MKRPNFQFISLIIVVVLITLFIRIPLPSKGYFNFGDIAVVFSGLLLGISKSKHKYFLGFIAGGLGSALADVIGGFGIYAPITFIAKGFEGFFSSYGASKKFLFQILSLSIAGLIMVLIYFVGEILMPGIGYQLAIPEILPNIVQAIGGIIGGRFTFEAYKRIVGDNSDEE